MRNRQSWWWKVPRNDRPEQAAPCRAPSHGSMALRFNKAGAEDLRHWAEELHRIAAEMEAEADQHDAAPSAGRQPVDAQP